MFKWLQDGVAWLLQLICGHGWTGGVEGAIPFAIGCAVVFIVGLCIIGKPDQNCRELQGFADENMSEFAFSAMFISFILFMVLFAAMYYSRSENWVFVFSLLTKATPEEFCPTPYNFSEWPLRMKIMLVVAVITWIWSIIGCKYDKKPLLALIDKFFVMGAMAVFIIAYFYIRELSDETGKSLGFAWLFFPVDLAFWVLLFILPVATLMTPAYTDDNKNKPQVSGSYGNDPVQSHGLPTGSMIQDSEGNSCRVRRDGDFVYIRRPDGTEEQVYAYEFDSTNSLTTSGGHHYNY